MSYLKRLEAFLSNSKIRRGDKMFERFTGLFSKWHCNNCNTVLKRKDVKYRSQFCGHYTKYWFHCLNCGSDEDVVTLKQREEEVVCSVCGKRRYEDE